MKEKLGGDVDALRTVCGLPVNTYFSASKMRWMLQNVDSVKQEAANDKTNMCFGTIDTWLVANLTSGKSIVTDCTNASRTMLMKLDTLEWHKPTLELFEIKE